MSAAPDIPQAPDPPTKEDRPEYLTVRELADLLRIKDRKVYDLAASGEVPCSRATGKLLFPAAAIRAWIDGAQTGPAAVPDRPAVMLGSHDPLLDWALRQSRSGLATLLDGSLDGLARFRRGEGVATGLHVFDGTSGAWNVPAVTAAGVEGAALVRFAIRRRGLVYRADRRAPSGLGDLAGLRFVPRQEESGTSGLLRDLAARDGVDLAGLTLSEMARSEDDAVRLITMGAADVAFGLEAVAREGGLGFLPLVEERFDILVDRKSWFDPPLQRLMAFCSSDAFKNRAAATGGYDTAALGRVIWNA